MDDLPFSKRPPRPFCCAIIPAYNEKDRVGAVAGLAVRCGLFAQVLVVDDGSTDGTDNAARITGARVISHAANQGKAQAMLSGLREAVCPVICFLDADLTGVTAEHLAALVDPVVEGRAEAALAVFSGGRLATALAQRIAPLISGQRCVKRELLDDFNGWGSGFGIETALNDHLRKLGVETLIVPWEGASQVLKEEKRGPVRGFAARLKMYWDILLTWLRTKLARRGRGGG